MRRGAPYVQLMRQTQVISYDLSRKAGFAVVFVLVPGAAIANPSKVMSVATVVILLFMMGAAIASEN